MRPATWDLFFNVLIFLFWYQVWDQDSRDAAYNAWLRPIARASERLVTFLEPIFFGLPRQAAASIAGAFLLVFRGLLVYQLAFKQRIQWTVTFGLDQASAYGVNEALVASVLSFASFLFAIAGLSLLYAVAVRTRTNYPKACLFRLASPFTRLPATARPLVLAATGIVIAWSLAILGGRTQPLLLAGVHAFLSACAAFVDLLIVISRALFVVIIASWIGTFMNAGGAVRFSREWMLMLLGPARHRPIRMGTIDLTPLVAMIALGLCHSILRGILAGLAGQLAG